MDVIFYEMDMFSGDPFKLLIRMIIAIMVCVVCSCRIEKREVQKIEQKNGR